MDKNRVVAYSLLAHINDSCEGISDFADIFAPLLKRVISKMCAEGCKGALLTDVKKSFDSIYCMDIPIPMVRLLIDRVRKDVNTKKRRMITMHGDGSLSLTGYVFSEFDEEIKKKEVEILEIEQKYISYLEENGFNPEEEPSIFEFLDQNRMRLSSLFSSRHNPDDEHGFRIQAEFVKDVMRESASFQILRRVYLGSIISCYLEYEVKNIENSNVLLLLDTSFIVSLLGLHSEASEHIAKQICDIAARLGYKLSVMNITIDETEALLNRIADGLHGMFFTARLDHESTESACARKGFGRTDLRAIAKRLKSNLESTWNIEELQIPESRLDEVEVSSLFERMSMRPHNPAGALHDAVAYLHIHSVRRVAVKKYEDANAWFVGDSASQNTEQRSTMEFSAR